VQHSCILIVDDDPGLRSLYSRLLRPRLAGHTVHVVASAKDALHAMEAANYQLVVSDLHMPAMGGRQLAARASSRCAETGRPLPRFAFCSTFQDTLDSVAAFCQPPRRRQNRLLSLFRRRRTQSTPPLAAR